MSASEGKPVVVRRLKPGTKLHAVLNLLLRRSLHRFQAERLAHDHVLHSSVSQLQDYGLIVCREWVTVPGFAGHPTRVKRYWLPPDQREKARQMLGLEGDGGA
ncbi:hypothetical protein Q4485_05545 [Granulosicoccaceae sp. 1_MG-2023]|nr:hypothetical protein [Granulosicoccaceae sp. 1_MG-2023]